MEADISSPKISEALEFSIIIPCMNEEDNILEICAAVRKEIAKYSDSYEIILIDNASTDGTRGLIRELTRSDPRVRAILNVRNFGQMRSPTYAIYQAEGRAVIAMCADFQDPPELIGQFIEQWRAGTKIVLGVRKSEKSNPFLSFVRRVGYALLKMYADHPIVPGATGFGLFDRSVVDALASWHEPEPFFRGMLLESGFSLALIPYDRPPRAAGETKNGFQTLTSFAISGLAGSSKGLLRVPILWSIPFGVISILLFGMAVLMTLLRKPGWIAMLVGVQVGLFAILALFIGLIGEQVRVLAERTRNVALVIEEERVNFPTDRSNPSKRTYVQARESVSDGRLAK